MSMITPVSSRTYHLLLLTISTALLLQGCPSCQGGAGGSNSDEEDASMVDMPSLMPDMGGEGDADMEGPIEEDTTAPVVMITSSTMAPYTGDYLLEGSARDDVALERVTYALDSGEEVMLTTAASGEFSQQLSLVEEQTQITVTATDRAGQSSTQTIEVTRAQPPELQAAFTVEGMPWLHEPLIFDASEVVDPLGEELTLTWEMGEGGESFESTRFGHAFHEPGDVVVTLTVTTEDGRSATSNRVLTIVEPMSVGVTELEGRVTDEDGFALPGVEVRLAGSDEVLGTSDLQGRYLVEIGQGVPSLITYHKAGWNEQLQRVSTTMGEPRALRDVSMARVKEQQIVLDASAAVEVSLSDGTQLNFQENSFVYEETGEPVEGQLLIEVTPIKPVGERGVPGFPGSFTALRQGRIPSGLATHGAVDVRLSQGKEKVQLAEGVEATILIPLGTTADIGQVIDLWSLDERNGLWTWEGTGEVMANPDRSGEKVMRADVSHFSVWNSDEPVLNSIKSFTLELPPLASEVSDLYALTHGRSPQGAAIQGGTSAPVSVSAAPDASTTTIELPIATDYNTRIEVGSQQGCLYGAVDVEAGANPDEILLEVFRTDEDSLVLEPGVTQTLAFDNDRPWEVAYFEEVPGQYWKVTIEATDGISTGTLDLLPGCGGTSTARLGFGPGATSSIVIAPGEQSRRALIFDAENVDAQVQVTLEALDAPALPTDNTLGQHETIDWQNNSTEERWVYLNREQVAHVALGGDYPSGAGLSFVTPSGDVRQPLRAPFTPSSYLFTAAESGWHLFVLNPFALPPEPRSYTLTIGEVLPEEPITYSQKYASSSLSGETLTLKRGDIQRYKTHKPGDEILFFHPRRAEGSPSPNAPRLGGQLTLKPAPDVLTPSYAIAEQPSNFEMSFYLFDAGLMETQYEVETETLTRDLDELFVGSCADGAEDTRHVMLAARAVAEGGLLNLCEGEHQVFDGLRFRNEGIRLRGEVDPVMSMPQDWPRIHGWPGDPLLPIEQQVLGIERVGWELSDSPLALRMNDLDRGVLKLEGVYVTGSLVQSSYAMRLRGPSLADWSQTQERALFKQIVIDATAQSALQIERFVEAQIDDVRVENSTERGLYLSDVSGSILSNVTILGTKQAIEWGGSNSHNNTLQTINISHTLSPQGGTPGIPSVFIQDHAPLQSPSTTSTSTLRVEDLFIELGHDSQVGLMVRGMRSNPTRMELDRLFIDGRGLANTTALQVQQAASGGTLEVTNSVLKGVTKHVIEVVGAQRFEELKFLHDTLELAGGMVTSRRELIELTGASATTIVQIINTIFSAEQAMSNTAGVDLYQATVAPPLGNLANNLFHQVTYPYASGNVAPFVTPTMVDDVAGDPMFINAMLEVDAMSPAINAGQQLTEVTHDYHGSPRPSGSGVDIGAYEQ